MKLSDIYNVYVPSKMTEENYYILRNPSKFLYPEFFVE